MIKIQTAFLMGPMEFSTDRDIYRFAGGQYLQLRVQSGRTITEVAEVAGVCRDTWHKIERGKTALNAVHLIRLQQAYGWELRYG